MSGILFPGAKAEKIAGFKVQTSVYGLPIPIVYGTARIAGNLIHMPTTPTVVADQGGKGVVSKGAAAGKTYQAAMVIALCEGPIIGIGNVWRDKDAKVAFTAYSAAGYGLALGTTGQVGWASLPAAQRLGYQSIAYVDHPSWPLPNDSLASYSWEIKGFDIFGSGVVDASPADIIPDYLRSAQYGVGFPAAQIGSVTAFYQYCAAFSLFCSPAFTSQQPARDQLNELLEVANTGAVWSDGVLKFVPYGDVGATAHGQTYTPNTTPVYDLTDNDYLSRGVDLDPVTVKRKSAIECFNQVQVNYQDRAFDYNDSSVTAEEQFSLLAYGPRPMPAMSLPSIKDKTVAQQVAWLRLQREQNVRNTYQFRLGWRFALLEPMDLVTLTDSGLGLNLTPVRITQITELENEDGFEVTAEDWPFGTASATRYSTASNSGTSSNANVDPGNTATPMIFDAPTELLTNPYELWIGASGGADWGGCDIYLSTDNVNFEKVGTLIGKSIYGVLTATMATNARYPAIDTTHTLAVDVTSSGGSLIALSQQQFDMLAYPCWLSGSSEFVTFRDLALTSAFHYNLTHLYRGLYSSTIPASHAVNESFVFCDEHIARIPWPQAVTGQTLYVKLPAFNIYGGATQDVATVSSTAFVVGKDAIARQNAAPQGTVAIDADGSWNAHVDGSSAVQSYMYVTSTSGYVSDATVLATGTIVTGRTFSISGSGLLFGETIYISIVPFTYANAGGLALPSIHIQGSFQTFTATKTLNVAARMMVEQTSPPWGSSFDVDNNIENGNITATPGQQSFAGVVDIPTGVMISSVEFDSYDPGGIGAPSSVTVSVARLENHVRTGLGSASVGTSGWQTLTISISETASAGRSYQLEWQIVGSSTPAAFVKQGPMRVVYSMPEPTSAR